MNKRSGFETQYQVRHSPTDSVMWMGSDEVQAFVECDRLAERNDMTYYVVELSLAYERTGKRPK